MVGIRDQASTKGSTAQTRVTSLPRTPSLTYLTGIRRCNPTVDPLHLATDLLGSDNASALVPTPIPSIDEDSLPPRDRCVFVVGTYRNGGWSSVYAMRRAVGDAGLTPVVVRDFDGRSRRDLEERTREIVRETDALEAEAGGAFREAQRQGFGRTASRAARRGDLGRRTATGHPLQ